MKLVKIYLDGLESKIIGTKIAPDGHVVKLTTEKYVPVPSKKNQRLPIVNKHTGKTFLKQSDQHAKWKKKTKGFWDEQYFKLYNSKMSLPIARCKVNIIFYFGDDKDRDCTNKAETIMDALVEHQILADDNFHVVSDISLKGLLCRDKPRTEIYITVLEPGEAGYDYDVTDKEKFEAKKKQKRSEQYHFRKIATPTP